MKFKEIIVTYGTKEIIKEKEQIIASEKDSEIFFNAITKTNKPNQNLISALDDYNAFMSKGK